MKKKTKSILKKPRKSKKAKSPRKSKKAKKAKKAKTSKRVQFDLSKNEIKQIKNMEQEKMRMQNNLYNLTALAMLFSKHFKPIFQKANNKPEVRLLIRRQYGGKTIGQPGQNTNAADPVQGGLDAIKQIQDTAMQIMNTLGKGGLDALKTGVGLLDKTIGTYINTILNQIDPGIVDKPWNEVAPYLEEKIKTLSDVMTTFITDYNSGQNQEFKNAVDNVVKLLGTITITLINQIKPEVDQITEKLASMAKKTATTSGKATVTAGMNFVKSGVSAIPIVGGLVNLMFAFGSMFNAATRIFQIFINTNSENAVSFTNAGKKAFDTLNKGVPELTKAFTDASKTFKTMQNVAAIPGASTIASTMASNALSSQTKK